VSRLRSQLARALALLAFALVAQAQPLRAQDAGPEATVGPRATTPGGERARSARLEQLRERRRRAIEQAPPSLVRHARDLRPTDRRALERSLRRMSEPQRQRFYREWERMSPRERSAAVNGFAMRVEARRTRELPVRLRTPEMRERVARMTPEERQDFAARAQTWREMDADERLRMRARLARFGELTEEEQQALVDEKFARKSPEERARILHQLREASIQHEESAAATADGGAEATVATPLAAPPPAPRTDAPAPD
jgi:hypothetical protein